MLCNESLVDIVFIHFWIQSLLEIIHESRACRTQAEQKGVLNIIGN